MTKLIKPTGSWVAIPTPFTSDNKIDFGAFELLIERQIRYGTSELFVLGSAGETTLLTLEEKKSIVKNVIKMTKGKIPTFFNASALTTEESVKFAQFCEAEGADGVIFTIPPYVLISQSAAYTHLDTCMGAINIPCGIYNNPSRLGVNVEPETIAKLSKKHPHFIVDKEAMGNVSQLVQVKRLCGDKINILCCDYPKYSIVIPTLAIGGSGTANIGGNIIPEEVAKFSRPWTDMTIAIARVPYSEVALAALLPALMYYLALFKMIDLESVRLNLAGIPEEELPEVKKTMKKGFKLFVPLIVLLILLIGLKLTPMMAAIWSILALILSSFFDSDDRMNLKKILDGCIDGLKSLPQVVAACACSGIVVGMFSLTGLGLKFSDFIVSLGANSLLLSLVLSMIVCIILGMGLPTTASYIIGATVLSPALIKLGLPTFSANLFIFYFACLSAITPPVAVAAYAAAGIAEENALKVGLTSVKLGITGFFMPYVFIFNPEYLHVGFDITTLVTWISAFVVCYSVAIVIAGYIEDKISILERILFAVIAVITIQTSLLLSVIGWILFGFFYGRKAWGHKKIFKTI